MFFLVLGLGPLTSLGAQETAILRIGPNPVRGIPHFPPNTLAAYRGEYVIGPAEKGSLPEPQFAEVLYTRLPLVVPAEWAGARCGNLPLRLVEDEDHYTLCYRDREGYTLFFQFPRQEPPQEPPQACGFVESFLRRFQILLGFVDAGREPPFPAVLQLPR